MNERIPELEKAVEKFCQKQMNNYLKAQKRIPLDCYDVVLCYLIKGEKIGIISRLFISESNGLIATTEISENLGLPLAYDWGYRLRKVDKGFISEWFEIKIINDDY
jgi:hypothetical protein